MVAGFTYRHYILKDHLGSWTTVTDAEGNVEQELSYDAWGNLRDPETWYNHTQADPVEALMFDRGYTGHEHMTAFGLINMNGRCYDPMMSSFLSVDAYLQDPTSAQGFNRYAYCAYNPLRYTDPTGWYMGPTDDNEGDGDGSNSGNSSAGIVIDPDSYTDYGDGWYSVGYSNGGVGGVYCWNNWKSTFSDVPSTHGQGTTYSDPSYYYPTISHNNGSGGHGTGGNIGGGNSHSNNMMDVNNKKTETITHSKSSSIATAALPVTLTCVAIDGPAPYGDVVGAVVGISMLAASGIVWIGEEIVDLYENLNGKNEQHGDNGRAIGKAESQIGELENQLKNAKSKKEKEKINRKIANIKKQLKRKRKERITAMETKDKKKNTLIPNTSVGVFVLGEPISNYLNKKHSVEYYEVLDEKYDSYIFYEDSLNVDVKKGVICSITCEESCYWQGRDIVRMNFKKFLEAYGLQYDGKDEIILEIGKGYQTHKVYDFDELGLQIWVWRNLIRTVIVSNYQDE